MFKLQNALYSRLPGWTTAHLLHKFSWKGKILFLKPQKVMIVRSAVTVIKLLVILNHTFAVSWAILVMKLVPSQILFSTLLVPFLLCDFYTCIPQEIPWDAHKNPFCFNGYSRVKWQNSRYRKKGKNKCIYWNYLCHLQTEQWNHSIALVKALRSTNCLVQTEQIHCLECWW